jgi:hypothetical protein
MAALEQKLEAAEEALMELASDYLRSGNDPRRRPSGEETYRVGTHVRWTLEMLAVLSSIKEPRNDHE